MKKIISTGVLCLLLAGCSMINRERVPDEVPDWTVGYAMPSFYPVRVTKAYGINTQEDWTSILHTHSQFMRISDLERIKQSQPDYDGYGLSLTFGIAQYSQIRYTNHLPDKVVLYWTSLFDAKFYITELDVTQKMKALAYKKQSYIRPDGIKRACYQTTFDFGFLPNGQVKVWLEGCGKYTYVTELSPTSTPETDYNGSTYSDHNQTRNAVLKRAKKANATLTPIPWDKVNKVYTSKHFTVDQLH
ncbi:MULTISPECIES: DUF2931 family protein [unclassified Photobacterium]|uniref:DUF2931 family protein n=1 Tax=unclassified Photobacterium TaxID=2628852 RepID=UPI000D165E12|nr:MULTISPECIES: DUF2931 family protein [unclassified Photobacterium]PSV40245.1 hypothetical protein C9J38_06985 [Photobacterium sp. GB-210]PSV43531.1 hypothetical protein C9J46_12125 [Photobacterium sp. GB-36]PSV50291.1 hypothetical protein C9J45_20740 [Photobacterium sp. GB-1]PSW73677.1 hypothetical protein C9J41_10735 [Photobacterium sp. GB-50]